MNKAKRDPYVVLISFSKTTKPYLKEPEGEAHDLVCVPYEKAHYHTKPAREPSYGMTVAWGEVASAEDIEANGFGGWMVVGMIVAGKSDGTFLIQELLRWWDHG